MDRFGFFKHIGISSRGSVLDTDCRVDRTVMETNFFGHIQVTKGYLILVRCVLINRSTLFVKIIV